MARQPTFNFGANRKAPSAKRGGKGKAKATKGKTGKGNAWASYAGGGRSTAAPF